MAGPNASSVYTRKLSSDEAAGLATAIHALRHLRELDDEQRDPASLPADRPPTRQGGPGL
jgi:hypothetical protein